MPKENLTINASFSAISPSRSAKRRCQRLLSAKAALRCSRSCNFFSFSSLVNDRRVGASAVAFVLQEIKHQRKSSADGTTAAVEPSSSASLPVLRRLVMRKCGMDAPAASLVLGGAAGLEGGSRSSEHIHIGGVHWVHTLLSLTGFPPYIPPTI